MSDSEKPKIIIDEDWKTQVEREKQEAADAEGAEAASDVSAADSKPQSAVGPEDIPPASFEMHVSSIATQILMAMGQFPDPMSEEGKPMPINLDLAKFHIDTLAMLEEKTKGNLSSEEAAMLTDALHQLRMMFVHVQQTAS